MSSPSENPLKRLIGEIHRRSLWQVLGIYGVASWVVFEVVQTLTEGLGLPEWFPAFAFVLLLIGLPIVLATAFVQEGGPGREEEEGSMAAAGQVDASPSSRLFTWRNALLGGTAALALWGAVALGWVVLKGDAQGGDPAGEPDEGRVSIAVLPFANLAEQDENAQFTAGLHDDILTQLSQIDAFRVVSRTSVQEYRNTEKNVRDIARELGVEAVLEGGVQRSGHLLRVNVQLIDADSDEHLWASRFTRELTLQNIFDIQSEIAVRVAEALRTELTPQDSARIESRSTASMEAYDLYLRARAHRLRRHAGEDAFRTVELLERAVEIDSEFAEAWALLADSRLWLWWFIGQPDQLDPAEEALEWAVTLGPELYETKFVQGNWAYRVQRRYEEALEHYRAARELNPSESEVLIGIGAVYRRLGRWEEAAQQFERAATLDPGSHDVALTIGDINRAMRRYKEAERALDRGISIAPDLPRTYYSRLHTRLMATGDTVEARRLVEGFPESVRDDALSSVILMAPMVDPAYYRGDFGSTLELWREARPGDFGWRALLHHLRGEADLAEAYADSVLEAWRPRLRGEDLDEDLPEGRSNEALAAGGRAAMGIAQALRGEADSALRSVERARDILPLSQDALVGPRILQREAIVRTLLGQDDAAVEALETVLSVPSDYSAVLLRIEPLFAPLRDHPRFQALLKEYEDVRF